MRFFPHCLPVLLALTPGFAHAQTAQNTELQPSAQPVEGEEGSCTQPYTGFVKSGEKPLAGANVLVKGTNVVLATNQEGFFVLPTSVRKWPTLSVSAQGHEPVVLTYRGCAPLTVNLRMLPGTRFKKHGRRKGFIVVPK